MRPGSGGNPDLSVEAGLARLHALEAGAAVAELLACCGSRRWAQAMAAARPFGSKEELLSRADEMWWDLDAEDWLEAFRAHPRLGESGEAGEAERRTSRSRRWSEGEQAGARRAEPKVVTALASENRAYEERFGHVFLLCATGKSADRMLASLRERLDHEPEEELKIAAGEQAKITRLRLDKWLKEA